MIKLKKIPFGTNRYKYEYCYELTRNSRELPGGWLLAYKDLARRDQRINHGLFYCKEKVGLLL